MAKIIKVEDNESIDQEVEPILRINEEFEKLLETPSEEYLKELERSLIEEGCRQPIDIWGNHVIDGHIRYRICQKHGIYFKTRKLHFEDEEHARLWILRNQRDRRNLKDAQVATIDLEIKALEKKGIKIKRTEIYSETDSDKEPLEKEHPISDLLSVKATLLANASKGKLFRYQSVVGEISSKDPEAIKKREDKIFPSYDKLLELQIFENEQENFPQKEYNVVYADFYKRDPSRSEWIPKILISRIKNIPMRKFLSRDVVAFLWSPISHLENTLNILRSWDLNYRTMLTLDNDSSSAVVVGSKKKNSLNMRPLPSALSNKNPEEISEIEYFRSVINKMYPKGTKIQLFIDQESPGWGKYQKKRL